jgi:hypothetical protein
MRQHTVAIACAAICLTFMSTPVGAVDCVGTHVTLTAESGEQYVLSCTPSKPREQDIADRRRQPIGDGTLRDEAPASTRVSGEPPVTAQAAQAR